MSKLTGKKREEIWWEIKAEPMVMRASPMSDNDGISSKI